MTQSRREAALELATTILSDIELSQIPAPDIVRKTSRLARLLDDTEAVEWLSHEIQGYNSSMTSADVAAATRSHRIADKNDKGEQMYWTNTLDRMQADIDGGLIQLQAAVDGNISIASANPYQVVQQPQGNTQERSQIRKWVAEQQELIGKVIGSIHAYVSEREIELRFGAAVESAFTTVRNEVDARIASLAPSAATKLAAAFENASSGNPEHWANAASACRRLLKAIADELRPPGPPVNNRAMTDDKYINRLMDWIEAQQGVGGTLRDVVTTDLADLGNRLDAFDDAGHKGAHDEVTQYEASRFITGAYLLIGDILQLWAEVKALEAEVAVAATITADMSVAPENDDVSAASGDAGVGSLETS